MPFVPFLPVGNSLYNRFGAVVRPFFITDGMLDVTLADGTAVGNSVKTLWGISVVSI